MKMKSKDNLFSRVFNGVHNMRKSMRRGMRRMVGPIFNGGLVRESLEDMLSFKEDTMFQPQFIGFDGNFAYN